MITAFFSSHIFRRELSRVTHESRRAAAGRARAGVDTYVCMHMHVHHVHAMYASLESAARPPTADGAGQPGPAGRYRPPLPLSPPPASATALRTVTRADNDIHDTRRTNKTRRHVRAAPRFSRALFIARNRDLRENPKHGPGLLE
jgi:hypothetical protein